MKLSALFDWPHVDLTADDLRLIAREEANGHSIYGASKSHRILACLGSLRAEFGLPDTAKYEAAEGTVAHHVAEEWLKTGVEPRWRIGKTETLKLHTGTYEIPVDEVMFTHLRTHIEKCFEIPGKRFFEQRVDYSRLTPIPNQGGTLDFGVADFDRAHLTIVDLKYGVADQIFAFRNPQCMLYALGFIFEWYGIYGFKTVTIRIHQPRLDHFDVWETTVEELISFAEEAREKFYASWSPVALRTPGSKQCMYCKAGQASTNRCPQKASRLDMIIDGTFTDETPGAVPAVWEKEAATDLVLPDPDRQSTEVLIRILSYRATFERGFQDVYDELRKRILGGEKHSDWFVAEGRISREVKDEDGVLSLLEVLGIDPDLAVEREFRSPAKLEELLVANRLSLGSAKRLLKPYVRENPGKPVVSERKPGKREALDLAEATFEDESLDI